MDASRPQAKGDAVGAEEAASEVRLNGNLDLLRQIVGEGQAFADIQTSFPLGRLAQRDNFLSLLHYFGLLSMRETNAGRTRLAIPNETVRRLLYGHLRDAYDDVGVLSVDLLALADALWGMAVNGEWRPVFDFLRDAIATQTGIRDYLDGEKIIQGFLAAYLGVSRHFLLRREPSAGEREGLAPRKRGSELNKGFSDISLEPLIAQYPELRHGYLIELKYIPRGDGAGDANVQAAVRDAEAQLRRYLADERLDRMYPTVRFSGLVLVFRGWEMVWVESMA